MALTVMFCANERFAGVVDVAFRSVRGPDVAVEAVEAVCFKLDFLTVGFFAGALFAAGFLGDDSLDVVCFDVAFLPLDVDLPDFVFLTDAFLPDAFFVRVFFLGLALDADGCFAATLIPGAFVDLDRPATGLFAAFFADLLVDVRVAEDLLRDGDAFPAAVLREDFRGGDFWGVDFFATVGSKPDRKSAHADRRTGFPASQAL